MTQAEDPETQRQPDCGAGDPTGNKIIAGKFLESMRAGPEAAAAWVTEDFIWHMCRSTDIHFPGQPTEARGIGGLRTLCEQEYHLYDRTPTTSELHFAIAENDRVALHYTMRRRTKAGMPYENDYCVIFQLRGGKVAQVWKLGDSLYGKRQYDAVPKANKLGAVG